MQDVSRLFQEPKAERRPSDEDSPVSPSDKEKYDKESQYTSELSSPQDSAPPSAGDSLPKAQPPVVPPGPPPPQWSLLHEYAFIFNICLAQFITLAALAQTIAPLLLIGHQMKVRHPGQLSWFTAAYSMSLGTFILPAGRIGDMYGHKRVFMFGWLWFGIWSLIAGFGYSQGPIFFSVARGFQGIGPALVVPNAMALVGRTFPIGNKRNMVFSLFAACGPTGFVMGAAMSSLLAERLWWPWALWITAVVCALAAIFSYLVIPASMSRPATPPGQDPPKFDFLGCGLGVSGLILINFSLNQAPIVGWPTAYIYFILLIGLMLTVAFIYIEMYHAEHPLLPLRGLQKQAIFALACIAAGWASHGIWLYYFYMFLMRVRGVGPVSATACLAPVAPIGVAWALSTGVLLRKTHVSLVMFAAMMFFFIGTVLLAFVPERQSYWLQTFFSVIIMPGGMNLSFPAGTILLSNAMPREHQGKAASLVSTVVNYSIASGLGFAGSVERSVVLKAERTGNMDVMVGYRGGWFLGCGLSGLGVLISLYFVWVSRKR
ncbi:MFS general substrate transporter [Trichodelitschia bisporula]|uniref:MFS general substrate transporter n=1 Tax=Trichodelitschia bisporula TaxID=703511 RepID=A0A6G1HXW4_9PEZI|nr:MFS general substrate transporter [Trichodelitschia bisporula]